MAAISGISVQQVINMMQWCREHDVLYATGKAYPYVLKVAEKSEMQTPSGIRYYLPTKGTQQRAYLLWYGEHRGDVAEAFAHILMTTDRTQLILLRCKRASLVALGKERSEDDKYRMSAEVDAIHDLVYIKHRGGT
jgi:hypothetical protein